MKKTMPILCALALFATLCALPAAAAKAPLEVPVAKSPLAVGWQDYYAIRSDGTLITWGSQEFGGFEETVPFEQARELMTNAAAVYTSGRGATLAIDNDGGLWAFNTSQFNDTVPGVDYQWERDEMKPVKIMDNVAMAAMDQFHSVILKQDGTLWVNGWGSFGAPWLHKTGNYLVQIMDNVIWTDLHYAVTADHELWGWRMTGTDDQPPRRLSDLEEGVVQVSWANLALTEQGNVYHWDVNSETGAIERLQTKFSLGNITWLRAKLAIMEGGALWYYVEDFIPGRPGWENPNAKGDFQPILQNVAYATQGERDILAIQRDGSLWKLSPREEEDFPSQQTELGGGFHLSAGANIGLTNFSPVQTYQSGQFSDVKSGDWFEDNVKAAYELGLMEGQSGTAFAPRGSITVAEAITIAARVRDIYYDEGHDFTAQAGQAWYQPYVDYATEEQMLYGDLTGNFHLPATRAQLAWLLSCALPGEALEAVNPEISFPDINEITPSRVYDSVMALARAGVITGKENGLFDPEGTVLRCEAAAMLSRAVTPNLRLN